MQSPNKARTTKSESDHIAFVKGQPCVVCDQEGPSDAHEIEQGFWWTSIPLCRDCHQGSHNGIHGQKRIWLVKKMTELSALNQFLGTVWAKFHRSNPAVRRAQ